MNDQTGIVVRKNEKRRSDIQSYQKNISEKGYSLSICSEETTYQSSNSAKETIKRKSRNENSQEKNISLSGLLKRSQPIPTIRSNLNSSNKSKLFLMNLIFDKIDNNQTYQCNYAHFHVLNSLAQAQRMTMFNSNQTSSIGYHHFKISLKKLNILSKTEPLQLKQAEFYHIITQCLKYYKHKLQQRYYSKQLRAFIDKYQIVLNNFMPLYRLYFSIVANFEEIFKEEVSVVEVMAYFKKEEEKIRQKYNTCDY